MLIQIWSHSACWNHAFALFLDCFCVRSRWISRNPTISWSLRPANVFFHRVVVHRLVRHCYSNLCHPMHLEQAISAFAYIKFLIFFKLFLFKANIIKQLKSHLSRCPIVLPLCMHTTRPYSLGGTDLIQAPWIAKWSDSAYLNSRKKECKRT